MAERSTIMLRFAQPEKPVTQREPNAVDVIATPAQDLNLKKDEIPPLLLAAQQDPYSLVGIRAPRTCPD